MGSIGKISLVMDQGIFATVSEVTVLRSSDYPCEVLFTYYSGNYVSHIIPGAAY
jgi:hypothetical protein